MVISVNEETSTLTRKFQLSHSLLHVKLRLTEKIFHLSSKPIIVIIYSSLAAMFTSQKRKFSDLLCDTTKTTKRIWQPKAKGLNQWKASTFSYPHPRKIESYWIPTSIVKAYCLTWAWIGRIIYFKLKITCSILKRNEEIRKTRSKTYTEIVLWFSSQWILHPTQPILYILQQTLLVTFICKK